MIVLRATMCALFVASLIVSTGAKHTSVPASIASHSSRVFVLNSSVKRVAQRVPAVRGPSARAGSSSLEADALRAARRRTAARASRARRTCRRRSRRCRRTARRCRAGWCRAASSQTPMLLQAPHHRHQHRGAVDHRGVDHLALARRAAPRGCAHTTPKARNMPPPPKSPTRLIGGVGLLAGAAEVRERAGERDVVDVVAGGLRHTGRPGPSRSCGRRRACGLRARHTSGPRPSRSVTPGRKPSMSASACSTSRSTGSTPVGVLEVDADRRAGRGTASSRFGLSNAPAIRPARRGRRARRRRPCRRAASRRTGPARSRPARRSSPPATVPRARSPSDSSRFGRVAAHNATRARTAANYRVVGSRVTVTASHRDHRSSAWCGDELEAVGQVGVADRARAARGGRGVDGVRGTPRRGWRSRRCRPSCGAPGGGPRAPSSPTSRHPTPRVAQQHRASHLGGERRCRPPDREHRAVVVDERPV